MDVDQLTTSPTTSKRFSGRRRSVPFSLATVNEEPKPLLDWSALPNNAHTLFLKYLVLAMRYLREPQQDEIIDWMAAHMGHGALLALDELSEDFKDFCMWRTERRARSHAVERQGESFSGRPERRQRAAEYLVKAAGILSLLSMGQAKALQELARSVAGGGCVPDIEVGQLA